MPTESELRERLANIDAALAAAVDLRDAPSMRGTLERLAAERRQVVDALAQYGPALDGFPTTRTDQPAAGPAARLGEPAAFGPEQRTAVTDWARARKPDAFAEDLSLSKYLRGVISGRWDGAEPERRAWSEGGATAGKTTVPTPLAASVIDLARNRARVFQAGALTVPMDSQTLSIARISGDPTAAWRSEEGAIAEGTGTIGSLTFTARSLAFYLKVSRELIEDASAGGGIDAILRGQIADVVALELDRAALRGSGTPPEPKGILNQTSVTLTDHGAAGTQIGHDPASKLGWDMLIDAAGVVAGNNFEPSAHIMAPRSFYALAKLRDATTAGQYLLPPQGLAPRLHTKQVPINLTVGGSSDCSEVYTGDFRQCLIGVRTELEIDVLREAGMIAAGQYYFVAWARLDVQLSQPTAFVVDRGVRGFG